MKLQDFDFNLPGELIAIKPVYPRDSSRMLYVKDEQILDKNFKDILKHLTNKDLIIFNNSKVIAAKLTGTIGKNIFELNLHKKISDNIWKAFAKKTKKIKIDDKIIFSNDFYAKILHNQHGELILEFNTDNADNLIEKYGKLPLPLYIKRDANKDDSQDYQTIYAEKLGSVAAPTAGLHFSQDILESLKSRNIKYDFVTLHVGAGTFLPVKVENINEHKMHSEFCEISQQTADLIKATKKEGGKVVAIGTTALRLLEYVAQEFGEIRNYQGENDIFIKPGFEFKIVDILLTNFHLPKSTLFMLVSAFVGTDIIKNAYNHAIENKYRFYSYGDCCLLNRKI